MTIVASEVYYIKLGRGGEWERDCIKINQTLRLGYHDVSHQDCKAGNWNAPYNYYIGKKVNRGTARSHTNQIKKFYESDEKVLWITFMDGKMWWCFSKPSIKLLADGSKIRHVIGKWKCKDIQGNELDTDNLSGDLLKIQAFRGTICNVKLKDYVLMKINGRELPEVKAAKEAQELLEQQITSLIKLLHWKDFEILVDLIFRQAGWQRMGVLGKTEKTLDIDLLSPVTRERALVQIKSMSTKKEFDEYCVDFAGREGYQKFFYVVHTPDTSLKNVDSDGRVKLLLMTDVAQLVINSGLTGWLLSKVS